MRCALLLFCALSVAACGEPLGGPDDPCGLGVERPELPSASARYTRDGQPVNTTGGGYKLGFPHDIVIGGLTINIKQDVDRRLVEELVDVSAFPICVPLDDRDDGSGYALLEDGGVSYSTSVEHSGTIAILAKDGDALIGRFAFEAMENSGATIIRVTDGAFNLLPR